VSKENSPQAVTSKCAAIWARVSTHDQAETSIPSQVSRCKEKLVSSGYQVVHTFAVDWSSIDLFSCPEFQQLLSLIKNKELDALGVFDRDRLEAKGLQRLTFLSLCREAGVQLILCQGPAILDEPEGQLVELALAIGKERQVLRARQGSRDGLHDRAVKRGLPVTFRKMYGYDWDKQNLRLVPDKEYINVKLIFDLVLGQGKGYQFVINELKRRGILSPTGLPEWNKTTLSGILHSPTYAGRYYALKRQACEPTHRPKKSSRVNSSVKRLKLDEAHYMPNIEVVDAPIRWEDRQRIDTQLAEHQKLALRNAKRDYLLRGLIVCDFHRGKQGEPRVFHGKPHHDSYAYVCSANRGVDKCSRPFIRGPELDEAAKLFIKMLFVGKADDIVATNAAHRRDIKDIDRELKGLDIKLQKIDDREASAYIDLKDKPGVLARVAGTLTMQRNGLAARQEELFSEKAEVGREKAAVESLRELAMNYNLRILSAELTNAEWRDIFTALNFSVRVGSEDPGDGHGRRGRPMPGILFEVGVPLTALQNVNIASVSPAPDLSLPLYLRAAGAALRAASARTPAVHRGTALPGG
jgi:site-specific DNA recombinase